MPFVGSIGIPELVIVLVIVMIIFGVGRLTEIGGALGKSIREFRKASDDEVGGASASTESKSETRDGGAA